MNQQNHGDHIATPLQTRTALLKRAVRNATPIRRAFVQAPKGTEESGSQEGPLADFVRRGDRRGLLTYLFALALTSSSNDDGWTTTRDGLVWARALGMTTTTNTNTAARAAAWKAFGRLHDSGLLRRARGEKKSQIKVTLLHEDGSGREYTRPGKEEGRYFQLPHRFWTEKYFDDLDLPAIAMLLVLLTGRGKQKLPQEKMPAWYGWSADTAARGLKQLREIGLIEVDSFTRPEPLAPKGWTSVNEYRLDPAFRSLTGSHKGEEVSTDHGEQRERTAEEDQADDLAVADGGADDLHDRPGRDVADA
ncbi:hypothetical protein [Nocardiopsis alba]|uniref:hypothetical protein n=1 Tax=Nocardiopsis alba TaxID=53437 RepID=UPI0033D0C0BC